MRLWHGSRVRVLVLGVSLIAGLAAHPAQAQFFGYWTYGTFQSGIDPEDVPDIVAQVGLRLLAPPRRNGRVFVADASNRRGTLFRLIISAETGDIVQQFRVSSRQLRGEPDVRYWGEPPLRRESLAPIPRAKLSRAEPEPHVIPGISGPERAIRQPRHQAKPKPTRPAGIANRGKLEPKTIETKPPETPNLPVAPPAAPPPAPATTARTPVNDIPVAPLDDVGPRRVPAPINDIPVAPLN